MAVSTHSRSDACGRIIRSLDLALALAAILVFLPTLLMIALAIRLSGGGGVLFVHRRIGADGRSFGCLKFRTMWPDAGARLAHLLHADPEARAEWAAGHKLRDDPRVTPVGRLLRRLSLDELPQLWNVVVGEMSLVGPRPIVAAEAWRYGTRYLTYCRVRPGLTGLWQVSGRSDVRYRRRVAMDVAYARKPSVRAYVSILARTPTALLARRGAY